MEPQKLSVEESSTLQQLQQHNRGGLPVGHGGQQSPEPQPTPEPERHEPEEETQIAAQSNEESVPQEGQGSTFEVDGQTFASEKDALNYLQQRYSKAEQDNLLLEARLDGMQQALYTNPQATPPPTQEMVDDVTFEEDKYYENPAQYLADYTRRVTEASEKKLERKLSQREQDAQAWNTFTSKYPELAQFQSDVLEMYNTHRDTALTLAKRSPEKAMDFIAMKTKEKFQRYIDSMKPTKVLSNTHQGPSMGSNTNVTSTQKTQSQPKRVDFTTQLRNMRRK